MSNKETHEYLIENNNWLRTYKQEIDAFKHYCLNASDETGSNIYHDVLAVLGINLTVSELETITKASTGKRSLFTTICQNYLENNDIDGTINVLFSNDWNNLSDIEKEVLRILRIIFEDDDLLLTDEADLFEDEIAVRRFKRDCAEILMYYPEKQDSSHLKAPALMRAIKCLFILMFSMSFMIKTYMKHWISSTLTLRTTAISASI